MEGSSQLLEDDLWEVLQQGNSPMYEVKLGALKCIVHGLLLGLCPFPVYGKGELFLLFSKGEVLHAPLCSENLDVSDPIKESGLPYNYQENRW